MPYKRREQSARSSQMRYDDENIIDIVKSSNYPYQNREYNKAYRKWRSDGKNSYAYRYVNDRRENCYMEGVGYIKTHPEIIERTALSHFAFAIGIAFMAQLCIEFFGGYFLALFVNLFGGGISWELLGGFISGPDVYAVVIGAVVSIAAAVVPLFMLYFTLQMPTCVAFPVKIIDKKAFAMALPFAMVALPVGLFCQEIYGKILGIAGVGMGEIIPIMPQNKLLLVLSLVVFVIIIPIISGICLDGILLQSLRQYGDGFALIVTALAGAFFVHDITQVCFVAAISLAIGFFVLRTGSVLTAILMRVVLRFGSSVLLLIRAFAGAELTLPLQTWALLICLIVGAVLLFFTAKKVKAPLYGSFGQTSLPIGEKIFTLVSSPIMAAWVVLTFILTIGCIRMA